MNKVTTTKRFAGWYDITITTPAGNTHEMTLNRFSADEWELTSMDFDLACAGWWRTKANCLKWLKGGFDENEQGSREW